MTPRDLYLPRGARWLSCSTALVVAWALSACSEHRPDATQVAARVNQSDVTVHQINFLLQQDRGLRPEQFDGAGRQVLESLIDQELAVQKAIELKLDRDPQTVQALEAARREVLARAYKERITQGVAHATPEEARRFYESTPALFSERRVYSLQELTVDIPPDRLGWVREQLGKARGVDEFAAALKAEGLRYSGSHTVKPAEQLPMAWVERFARMKDGDSALMSDTPAVRVVFIAGSRTEPVSFERAAPAIEQYLGTLAKRKAIDDNLKALRSASQIAYQGKFAGGPGAAGRPASSALPGETLPALASPIDGAGEPVRMPLPDAAPLPASAGSGMDPNIAKKGMGLK